MFGLFLQTLPFRLPNRQHSHGARTGEQAGHKVLPIIQSQKMFCKVDLELFAVWVDALSQIFKQ